MPKHHLPAGYSPLPPGETLIPGAPAGYGGATLTCVTGYDGTLYVGMCATAPEGTPEPRFRFRVFAWRDGGAWTEIPLQRVCTGRGSVSFDTRYRRLRWQAWNGSTWDTDWIPGVAAYTAELTLEAVRAWLVAKLGLKA